MAAFLLAQLRWEDHGDVVERGEILEIHEETSFSVVVGREVCGGGVAWLGGNSTRAAEVDENDHTEALGRESEYDGCQAQCRLDLEGVFAMSRLARPGRRARSRLGSEVASVERRRHSRLGGRVLRTDDGSGVELVEPSGDNEEQDKKMGEHLYL